MSTELVSVILPVKNKTDHLSGSVRSILNQSYENLELIAVDDSEVPVSETLNTFNDGRIKFIKGKNKGLSSALNLGISEAKGVYIARMDADDISLADRLELQVKHLEENPAISVTGCNMIYINEKGKEIYRKEYPKDNKDIEFFMPVFTSVPHPAVLARKEIFTGGFKYDENVLFAEDLNLFLKMLESGVRFSNVQEYLYEYRFHKDITDFYLDEYRRTLEVSRKYVEQKKNIPGHRDNPELKLQSAYVEYYKGSRKLARKYFSEYLKRGSRKLSIYKCILITFLPDGILSLLRNIRIKFQLVFRRNLKIGG